MVVPHDPAQREPSSESSGCARPDLARLLLRIDELVPSDMTDLHRHARGCPSCGPRLRLLEEAEVWLASRVRGPHALESSEPTPASSGAVSIGECPAAEELYDFGQGPGARPLPEATERTVREHVEACGECADLVATLASRPPVPLDLGLEPEPPRRKTEQRPRPRRLQAWLPLAAAALLLVTLGLFWNRIFAEGPGGDRVVASAVRFPPQEIVRGEDASALNYPRGRVLAGREAGLWHALRFELTERSDARRYRVYLLSADGGAFARGRPLAEFSSEESVLTLDDLVTEPFELQPGTYTWEAWADINGLDTPLGRQEFEVVRNDEAERALAARADASAILSLLHADKLFVDARGFARSLPASPERDRYLDRAPAR